jgi:hypothetical protein
VASPSEGQNGGGEAVPLQPAGFREPDGMVKKMIFCSKELKKQIKHAMDTINS